MRVTAVCVHTLPAQNTHCSYKHVDTQPIDASQPCTEPRHPSTSIRVPVVDLSSTNGSLVCCSLAADMAGRAMEDWMVHAQQLLSQAPPSQPPTAAPSQRVSGAGASAPELFRWAS